MKFNIGDKVRITKVNPLTRRQYERFIGTEWEVWEAKDNGEYILSFGSHKVWHEDQLELVERAPVPGGKRKYTGRPTVDKLNINTKGSLILRIDEEVL